MRSLLAEPTVSVLRRGYRWVEQLTVWRHRVTVWVLMVLMVCACTGCGEGMVYYVESPVEFLLPLLGGEAVDVLDYQGKVLLVQFWATWCPPCLEEIPHFNELYLEYRAEGLEILSIALDQRGEKALKSFLRENRVVYPILLAHEATVNIPVTGIPMTYVIDRELNVVRKFVGYHEKQVFLEEIRDLL